MASQSQFNQNIHGCRGLFASLVFLFHVENADLLARYFWNTKFVLWFFPSFASGVELFFCISGYVILMSMMRTSTATKFMTDRLLRIMPVVIVLQVLLFVGGSIVHDKQFAESATLWEWSWLFVANALLLPGIFDIPQINPPAWSLSFEMLFYIVACLFYYRISRVVTDRRRLMLLIGVVALPFFALYPRAAFFSVGIFALLLEDRIRGLAGRWWFTPFPWLVVFLLAWRIASQTMVFRHTTDNAVLMPWMADDGVWMASCVLAYLAGMLFFFSALHDNGWFGRLLRTPVAQYMGTISYSFYLWQACSEYVCKRFLTHVVLPVVGDQWGTTLLLVTTLPLSLGAAHLSYRFIERDLAKWLRQSWKQRQLERGALEPSR
jgi:peptidoglycan/LPS O-acetylase OafA/YrhL